MEKNNKKHTFWDTKPIMVNKNKLLSNTPNLVQKVHGFKCPELSASLYWDVFHLKENDSVSESKIEDAYEFLKNNYSTKDSYFQIQYSKNHLEFELGKSKNIIVAIRTIKNNSIVGIICGSVRPIIFHSEKWFDVLYINFLCVMPSLRHLGLAPKLITEISRQAHENWGIQTAYYNSSNEIPIPFSKTVYLHRILDIHKCIETRYWMPTKKNKYLLDKWSKNISENKKIYDFNLIKHTKTSNDNTINIYSKMSDWINSYYSRNKVLYEEISQYRMEEMCTSDCIEVFIINNKSTQKPIGCISVFHHIYKIETIDKVLNTGILYHYGIDKEEEVNSVRIFTEFVEFIKSKNIWDVFTTTDTSISDNTYIEGHSYYHYMYNVNMPELSSNQIGLIGL